MASATESKRYTPEQYLAMERKADFKSEYDNGFITAMAGGSHEHNTIAAEPFRRDPVSASRTVPAGLI